MSWLWTLAGLAEWPGWQPGDLRRIAVSLAEHASYLADHLSYYSSPYNHLIGEAAGLFVLGSWLEGLAPAAGWHSCGREVLLKHGPRQFYRDGFCVEQATGYHFFTLGFLTHALATAEAAGEPMEKLLSPIAKAFEAGALFLQPDGLWPAIGDVDSARAIPVLPDIFWNFRSLYSLGAVLCDRPEFAATAILPGAELFWLLGTNGLDRFIELARQRQPAALESKSYDANAVSGRPMPTVRCCSGGELVQAQVSVLPDSGYAILRSGDENTADWLLFDCGPLADGLFWDATPSTAHGHADALQVLLHLGGQPVLSDPGMPFYFERKRELGGPFPAARPHHHLVEIEGCPIARHSGRLGWAHVCGDMNLSTTSSAFGTVLHGIVKLDAGNTIVRSVFLIPGTGVWIGDFITTDEPRQVCWNWQLTPAAATEICSVLDGPGGLRFGETTIMQWSHTAGVLPFEVEHRA